MLIISVKTVANSLTNMHFYIALTFLLLLLSSAKNPRKKRDSPFVIADALLNLYIFYCEHYHDDLYFSLDFTDKILHIQRESLYTGLLRSTIVHSWSTIASL